MPTLMNETPYIAAVLDEMRPVVCSGCFKHLESGLKKCLGCKTFYYCGAECQKNDWADHKLECKALKAAESFTIPYLYLMHIRVARKLARGDQGSSYNGRSWSSLKDHLGDLRDNTERMADFERMARDFISIMGADAPDLATAVSIVAKIQANSFFIFAPDLPLKIGVGVYLGISVHNHSCDPDLSVVFEGKKASILSDNPNAVLKSKMTISKLPMLPLSFNRRKFLKEQYFIECDCRYCTDIDRDLWGRSAFVACCKKGVAVKGANSDVYKCVICGKPSPLSEETVHKAIDELDEFLHQKEKNKDIIAEIDNFQELFKVYSKILSPFNYWMVDLSDRIVALAEEIDIEELRYKDRQIVLRRFSMFSLTAIRHYFPKGRWLLQGLLNAAAGFLPFEPPYKRSTLSLLKEVKDLSARVYGPEHHISQCFNFAVNEYSEFLRR